MMRVFLIVPLVAFMLLFVSGCREQRLKEAGEALAFRIDSFQTVEKRLPENLGELGIEEKMEGPLYYRKLSSENYWIYFGTTLGESIFFRSETREWRDY